MASNNTSSAVCSICSELYDDPRMLKCLHSFCKKCLQKHLENQETKSTLKCPTCKNESSIPEGGVEALQKDLRKVYEAEIAQYDKKVKSQEEVGCDQCIEVANGPAVSFCCNCCEFLCKVCAKHHKVWRKTLTHELVDVGKTKSEKSSEIILKNIPHKPMTCQVHDDEVLKFYCQDCNVLICRDCSALEHSGHKYNRVEKVAENEKKDLLSTLEKVNSFKLKLDDAMAQGEKVTQRVQAKQKSVDEEIKKAFKCLYDALKAREKELLAKSAEISLGKQTALGLQQEELKKVRNEIATISEMVTHAIEVYTPTEMLSAKSAMKSKLEDLLKQFEESKLQPCKTDMMPTSLGSTELVKAVSSFGVVAGGCFPACSTANICIPSAVISKPRQVLVTARDHQGKPFPYGGETVYAVLSLMGSHDPPVVGDVIDKGNGTYEVTFAPKTLGEHELAITIGNQPIKGSPFIISVRQDRNYSSLSTCQRNLNVSSYPRDVAIDDNSDVYVAVYGNQSVSVFNKSGTNIRTIGTPGSYGSGQGQFYSPTAIAIKEDVIYVAEESNHRVQKLSKTGKFISTFGTNGSGQGQLSGPRGICLDREGRIFVSESSNNRISVFSPDGTFAYHITGNVSGPWGVAFDPSGNLHVANYTSHTISVFSPDGTYITQYGSGVITYPAGIAVNEEGYSFISDYGSSCRLFILNSSHQLVHTIQNFTNPAGVALDKEGYVYIADYSNKRVLKY